MERGQSAENGRLSGHFGPLLFTNQSALFYCYSRSHWSVLLFIYLLIDVCVFPLELFFFSLSFFCSLFWYCRSQCGKFVGSESTIIDWLTCYYWTNWSMKGEGNPSSNESDLGLIQPKLNPNSTQTQPITSLTLSLLTMWLKYLMVPRNWIENGVRPVWFDFVFSRLLKSRCHGESLARRWQLAAGSMQRKTSSSKRLWSCFCTLTGSSLNRSFDHFGNNVYWYRSGRGPNLVHPSLFHSFAFSEQENRRNRCQSMSVPPTVDFNFNFNHFSTLPDSSSQNPTRFELTYLRNRNICVHFFFLFFFVFKKIGIHFLNGRLIIHLTNGTGSRIGCWNIRIG